MIANERPNDPEVKIFRSLYGRQQCVNSYHTVSHKTPRNDKCKTIHRKPQQPDVSTKKTRGSKEPVSLTLVYVNIKQRKKMDS